MLPSSIDIIYGIHHWRIFRSSYRKLAWVRFEPTTTKFRSDALTDWATRPWVQLALSANFVQLLQFHLVVQFSFFILAVAFVSRHICFKRNLAQVITVAAEWLIHMVFITYGIYPFLLFRKQRVVMGIKHKFTFLYCHYWWQRFFTVTV